MAAVIGQRSDRVGGLRSGRFYLDLMQAAATCARVLLLPRDKPVTFGFFVNGHDAGLRALSPDTAFIRVNYPRRKRGWSAAAFDRLVALLAHLAKSRRPTAMIWGYRDRINHGIDIGRHFPDHWRVERGLIRAPNGAGYTWDERSIYFDGRIPTDFERKLNALEPGRLPASETGRAILAHVLASGATKYGAGTAPEVDITDRDLLIIGQCTGDQAISETDALARTNPVFVSIVVAHLVKPGRYRRVFYKSHPKNGTTAADLAYVQKHHPDIVVIDARASIVPLLAAKPTVATLTSGVGLEGAVRGCKVHCFGVPFYSHWGFTVDHMPCPRRTNRLSPEDVLLAMLIEQMRYVDGTGRCISAAEAFGCGGLLQA
jgi:capsular polysaccharide export protein